MAGSLLPSKKSSGGPLHRQKEEAQRLGRNAAISGAATAGVILLSPILWTPVVVVGALAGAGYTAHLTWKWIQYRAEWGLKF